MATTQSRLPKTVEDYMRLPEGTLAELIGGEILMSPSPKVRHQNAVENLFRLLDDHVRKEKLGKVHVAPLDVHLPSGDVVQPDLLFVSTRNKSILQDWIRGVPDLLIEVLSPDSIRRDRVVKRSLYAKNGVKEYWIADPDAKTVEVLTLTSDRYDSADCFKESDTLTSPILSALSLPLRPIFE